MRCRPWRWLWGLLPLALIVLAVNWFERPRIEADLHARTQQALAEANLAWAATTFDNNGRDGYIEGVADNERARDRVFDIATQVWGVRTIDNKSKLLERADKYVWAASWGGNRVRIRGHVPSDVVRGQILDDARTVFPGAEVEDRMRLARGVSDLPAWLEGVRFGLRQLKRMDEGQAELENLSLTLTGRATSLKSYSEIRTALSKLARPLVLQRERIDAPVIKPFVWSAQQEDGRLVMTGYAASESAREAVMVEAQKRFARDRVTDRLEVAGGAPRDWQLAVMLALSQLAVMERGAARLEDAQLTLSGSVVDDAAKSSVIETVKRGLPIGYGLIDRIAVRTPGASAERSAAPFVTSVLVEGGTVTLSGNAPSEEASRAAAEYAGARWRGRRVENRLEVAPGPPKVWLGCLKAGLASLARLGQGRFDLRDSSYRLTGETRDVELHSRLQREVADSMPEGCEGRTDVTLLAVRGPSREEQEAQRRFAAEQARKQEDERRRAAAEAERQAALERDRERQEQEKAARAAAEREAAERQRRQAALEQRRPPEREAAEIRECQSALNRITSQDTINFDRYETAISRESYPMLDSLANAANSCPGYVIEVGGHTDARGGAALNERLSRQRAQAVAQYLIRRGVAPNRLTAVGYGPSKPVAPNESAEDRAKNRRIEFIVRPR